MLPTPTDSTGLSGQFSDSVPIAAADVALPQQATASSPTFSEILMWLQQHDAAAAAAANNQTVGPAGQLQQQQQVNKNNNTSAHPEASVNTKPVEPEFRGQYSETRKTRSSTSAQLFSLIPLPPQRKPPRTQRGNSPVPGTSSTDISASSNPPVTSCLSGSLDIASIDERTTTSPFNNDNNDWRGRAAIPALSQSPDHSSSTSDIRPPGDSTSRQQPNRPAAAQESPSRSPAVPWREAKGLYASSGSSPHQADDSVSDNVGLFNRLSSPSAEKTSSVVADVTVKTEVNNARNSSPSTSSKNSNNDLGNLLISILPSLKLEQRQALLNRLSSGTAGGNSDTTDAGFTAMTAQAADDPYSVNTMSSVPDTSATPLSSSGALEDSPSTKNSDYDPSFMSWLKILSNSEPQKPMQQPIGVLPQGDSSVASPVSSVNSSLQQFAGSNSDENSKLLAVIEELLSRVVLQQQQQKQQEQLLEKLFQQQQSSQDSQALLTLLPLYQLLLGQRKSQSPLLSPELLQLSLSRLAPQQQAHPAALRLSLDALNNSTASVESYNSRSQVNSRSWGRTPSALVAHLLNLNKPGASTPTRQQQDGGLLNLVSNILMAPPQQQPPPAPHEPRHPTSLPAGGDPLLTDTSVSLALAAASLVKASQTASGSHHPVDVAEISRSLRDDGRYGFDAQLRTHKSGGGIADDRGVTSRSRRTSTEYLCTYPGVSWNTRMQSWLVYFEDAKGRKSRTFNPKRLSHSQLEGLPSCIRSKYNTDPVEVAMHCACVYAARVRWEGRLRKSLGFQGPRSQSVSQTRRESRPGIHAVYHLTNYLPLDDSTRGPPLSPSEQQEEIIDRHQSGLYEHGDDTVGRQVHSDDSNSSNASACRPDLGNFSMDSAEDAFMTPPLTDSSPSPRTSALHASSLPSTPQALLDGVSAYPNDSNCVSVSPVTMKAKASFDSEDGDTVKQIVAAGLGVLTPSEVTNSEPVVTTITTDHHPSARRSRKIMRRDPAGDVGGGWREPETRSSEQHHSTDEAEELPYRKSLRRKASGKL